MQDPPRPHRISLGNRRRCRAHPWRWSLVLVAIALGACGGRGETAGSGAPREAELSPPRHLLLITVDTLRGDHTSLLGYERDTTPALRALAPRGVVFEHAIAQWPKTGTSFASMFTGRYPQSTGLTHKAALRIPEALHVLPEVLRAQGFRTVAVVSNPVLSRELGWDRGFDDYVEVWGDQLSEDPLVFRPALSAGRVLEEAVAALERNADAERLFAWIHFSDPHAPYVLPDGEPNPFLGDARYERSAPVTVDLAGSSGKAIGDHDEVRFYEAAYDANVSLVDRHLPALLGAAERLGLLRHAAVVVTADHGESLGEHGSYFEHGPLPYNTTAHVPLLLLSPDGRGAGRSVGTAVELVDLFPTVLDWLGLAVPGGVPAPSLEGRSLLPLVDGDSGEGWPPAFSEAGRPPRHFRSVQDDRWKLVFRPPQGQRPTTLRNYELYDLQADPIETRNLIETEPPELARLREVLDERMRSVAPSASSPDEPHSDDELRALRALGYVDETGEGGEPPG